eukprot:TRINITY_DN15594_c0_g1_i1.p1 TRINITY_DN15594_c0_g1~~TRINITY_DN15594_c0_g1_i1.p1  ORF type:complete len:914 (+),score=315.90 TRINITY_DN15594_c0_g1_i1:113-2854(+)
MSTDSVAHAAVDKYVEDGVIRKEEAESFKSSYTSLQEALATQYEQEATQNKKMKELHQQLLEIQISLQKASIRKTEISEQVRKAEKSLEQLQKQLEEAEEKETIMSYAASELQREREDLTREVDHMRKENQELVQPEFNKLKKTISSLKNSIESSEKVKSELETRRKDLLKRDEEITTKKADLNEELKGMRSRLKKQADEPGRVNKQASVVQKAQDSLAREVAVLEGRQAEAMTELKHQADKKKETERVSKEMSHKLDLHENTLAQRERDVQTVQGNLQHQQQVRSQLLEQRCVSDLELKQVDQDLRFAQQRVAMKAKELELMNRKIKKEMREAQNVKDSLPLLKMQLTDAEHSREAHKAEAKKFAKQGKHKQQEVDIGVANFLKQEKIDHREHNELNTLTEENMELEAHQQMWSKEHTHQAKLISVLSGQREVRARETTTALQNEKEANEELKMRQLVIMDLEKKHQETAQRMKEFSTLYDIVKNERNKYVNSIQSATQGLAEMREKIKILQNEVEILRNESTAKDGALAKTTQDHQTAQAQRDALRLEANKCQTQYRIKQEQVEQQIVEIDKLNSLINLKEKSMLALKRQYETSMEERNYTGIQLIDRNDELCVLYEKKNIQEETLQQGEVAIREKDEEIRMLRIQVAEFQRQIEVARKELPKMPMYAKHILQLSAELQREEKRIEDLCVELETPVNSDRWRELPGEDPDVDQLKAKLQVLDQRFEEKKEQQLEKELVLEEVGNLAEKLKTEAEQQRSTMLRVAQEKNMLEAEIQKTTDRMKATVAELSMYSAASMKLRSELNECTQELKDAQYRLEEGEAPTEMMENEYYRSKSDIMRREDIRRRRMEESAQDGVPVKVTRTTADPRPNAYIPDELGIPKPYSNLGPFKPTETGSTMRHIRRPQPKPLEI